MKISDFGLSAQLEHSLSKNYPICGTSHYLAPEGYHGGLELKSDVWSLGMSMIEMVGSRNPYVGLTSTEFKNELLNKRPPSFSSSGWSNDLVDFVKKCLVKDVNGRSSVEELLKVSEDVSFED